MRLADRSAHPFWTSPRWAGCRLTRPDADTLGGEAGPQDALQRRLDLGEQAAEPVRHARGLGSEAIVVADQDLKLSQRGVAAVDPAQVVQQRAGVVGRYMGSRASVLAAPGGRSANRRIASPGR